MYNKYRNKPQIIDDRRFASKREANRYVANKLRVACGDLIRFDCQVPFKLGVNGIHICKYVADFVEIDSAGKQHVVDAKGVKTSVYKLKKNLMLAVFGIEIEEC